MDRKITYINHHVLNENYSILSNKLSANGSDNLMIIICNIKYILDFKH